MINGEGISCNVKDKHLGPKTADHYNEDEKIVDNCAFQSWKRTEIISINRWWLLMSNLYFMSPNNKINFEIDDKV